MTPARRKISMDRAWRPRALERGEMECSRSMMRTGMPSFVRRKASKRPTGPPPTMRTGSMLDGVGEDEGAVIL